MKNTPERIAVLTTSEGEIYIMRQASLKEVKAFAAEQNRRAEAGEALGPSGEKAVPVVEAHWWDSETNLMHDLPAQTERINLTAAS